MKTISKRVPTLLLALVFVGGALPIGRVTAHAETQFTATPMITYNMALNSDGTVWAWGASPWSCANRLRRLTNVVAISTSNSMYFALQEDGTVWCLNPRDTLSAYVLPTQVQGLSDVTAIVSSYALKSDGTVWAMKWQGYSSYAEQVEGLTGVTALVEGVSGGVVIALKNDGTVWDTSFVVQVQGLDEITEIKNLGNCMAAHKKDGTIWLWDGSSLDGQFGDLPGMNLNTPVQTSVSWDNLTIIKHHTPVNQYRVILKSDGSVWVQESNLILPKSI